jgi:hypothetical protein
MQYTGVICKRIIALKLFVSLAGWLVVVVVNLYVNVEKL